LQIDPDARVFGKAFGAIQFGGRWAERITPKPEKPAETWMNPVRKGRTGPGCGSVPMATSFRLFAAGGPCRVAVIEDGRARADLRLPGNFD
jgi:hypothetical protein